MRVGLRKKSLLVVDDNINVQSELRGIAEEIGFDVTTSSSRRGALDAIARRRYDAALVDMRLVEADPRNRDGMAILSALHDRAEGTAAVLLTGYGDYEDGVQATEHFGARQLKKRTDPSFEADVRRVLTGVMNASLANRRVTPVRVWCGNNDGWGWETMANSVLRPKGDIGVILKLLEELAITCDPVFERSEDNGLAKSGDGAISSLYWSRGIGEAVVVAVKRQELAVLDMSPSWPSSLSVQEELYRTGSRNLIGTISHCVGVEPAMFPVPRLLWD